METFLDKIAQEVLSKHQRLDDVCMIFPGRRAAVFFKKSLKKYADRALLLPQIFSMQDFVTAQTGISIADNINLSFELYEVHKQINSKAAESFEGFLKFSNTIIQDFNEIDMHLIDSEEAFRFLTDYSQLSVWNPEKSVSKEFQTRYMTFFASLSDYYRLFSQRLKTLGEGYQGLTFRALAEDEAALKKLNYAAIYIVGFNAFTPAEERIVDVMVQKHRAEIRWDADAFYLNDLEHEAGISLRKMQKKWPQFSGAPARNLVEDQKIITAYAATGNIAQVKTAGKLLEQYNDKQEVAVVLADESLLEPLLNSVPQNISTFNITMGLPLENTSLFALMTDIFQLHVAPQKMKKVRKDSEVRYYYKDILKVLAHPLIRQLMDFEFSGFSRFTNSPVFVIREQDKPFYSLQDLKGLYKAMGIHDFAVIEYLWIDWEQQPQKALVCFTRLLQHLTAMTADRNLDTNHLLTAEYVFRLKEVLNEVGLLNTKYQSVVNIDIFWRLFRQLAGREEVSFKGEPLKGIQVMGMLETRLLDFEQVILISANEEFLPGKQEEQTFMPYEMRQYYKLPSKKEKASVFAYHFYHLLQRSKNIHLIYNNHVEGMGNNEVSRFVKQIQYELIEVNKNITYTHRIVTAPLVLDTSDTDWVVEKDQDVIKRICKKAESGFSATSLNKYRKCSMKFYFEEILNVTVQEEVEETVEAKTMGIVVHLVLERLYEKHCQNKAIGMEALKKMNAEVADQLDNAFKEKYQEKDFRTGKNLLIYQLSLHWIKSFLEAEETALLKILKQQKGYSYLASEEYVKYSHKIKMKNKDIDVVFKGLIDRVDDYGGVTRIIDYKTGKVNPASLKIKSIDDFDLDTDKKEAFQLMFYQWLYKKSKGDATKALHTGILSFPALKHGVMLMDNGLVDELAEDFEQYVFRLVAEILDPDVAFKKTDDILDCKYCDFKGVCNRYS